ncbi:MAG TPA: glycoside hydrolase family 3 N-terminal domain-containing protein [Calditrichia bacterium]|nr:glycoside hydrolase family 3 N-terminal domain-containing protein [Calditrichia bacterium]HQV30360.1 glycoside hydrolase family 3 N-terminal domain-containing protein [Calditrichia bacterium]
MANANAQKGDLYHKGWIDLNKNGVMDPYENPALEVEQRIEDLLSRMSIEEKTCQMATLYGYGNVLQDELPTEAWLAAIWKDGIGNIDEQLNGRDNRASDSSEYTWPPSKHARALNQIQAFFIEKTRLGIPVDFTNEGIRGLMHDHATSFSAQIGIASTWNIDLVGQIGHITGREARALGYTNIYSPILDLSRDPRWGRTVESYSESPFLTAELGKAQVRGLQTEGVVSTLKHFAVYSIPKGGRDGWARTDPKAPWRDVQMIYLAPFKAAITEAGALGVMSSYNDYDGIPIQGNKLFLTEILRQQWGFKGYVVSDSRAVEYIWEKHRVAGTYKDAVRQAVEAGLNIRTEFTPPDMFIEPLRELVREGSLSMAVLDSRVGDVLRVKYHLGLFDKPYTENPAASDKVVRAPGHTKVSQQAAREAVVLLKNNPKTLPLSREIKSLLVVGPNGDNTESWWSRYGPQDLDYVSVLEGIRRKVGAKTEVKFAEGCALLDADFPESDVYKYPAPDSVQARIDAAAALAKTVDVAVVVLGESEAISKESATRVSLNLPGYQEELLQAIQATGTPTVLVLINGRPLTVNWADRHVPAIVEAWFPGEFGGDAIADVLFGDYNPGGKLPITFPKSVGQIPMNFPYKPASQAKGLARVDGVLYPFGHGLSYTEFAYTNLTILPEQQGPGGEIRVSLTVRNSGAVAGDEVVQLYLRDEVSSVITFDKVLRGFQRIHLLPGQSQTVTFTLLPGHLALYDRHQEWRVEPGTFRVMVGSSSEDIRLEGQFEIK